MVGSELQKTNSSSGEEDEELSSGGSDSDSQPQKKSPPPPESESDADSPPIKSEKSDPNIKPLASKPMDDEQLRKPRPKNPTSRYSPPLKSVTGKRKSAEVESELKISKTSGSEDAGEKKPLFQRLWSEDDEIELIQGMINYVDKKGKDPYADVSDFHEFVKNSLKIDVNNAQMSAKIKRLKAKFMNNVGKIELKGKVRSMSNPHEKKMYELSEKFWGGKNRVPVIVKCSSKKLNNGELKTNHVQKKSKPMVSYEAKANGAFEVSAIDDEIMRKGLELVSGSKKIELKENWNALKVEEINHFVKKLELLKEQSELVLNAIKKSGAS